MDTTQITQETPLKSMEFCLDRILKELRSNWDKDPYPAMNAAAILKEFGLTNDRHEFFKGLIDTLIEDGHAYYIDKIEKNKPKELEDYKQRIMLTVKGYYLIEHGGYTKIKIDATFEKNSIESLENHTYHATRWIAIGTVDLMIATYLTLAHELRWLPFCH
ncbi:MAG TPA: hypothetical protein VMI12_09440 [Puia sp.]|nr:hypothetical protein [Puia sp.]